MAEENIYIQQSLPDRVFWQEMRPGFEPWLRDLMLGHMKNCDRFNPKQGLQEERPAKYFYIFAFDP